MNLPRILRFLILLGILFSGYVSYVLVMMNDHAVAGWNFFYGILFSVCMICGWGLWNGKAWSWMLGLILALAALGLGIYFAHFAWTFWIFKRPTLLDRINAVVNPHVLALTTIPAIWLFYFLKPDTRNFFRS